MLVISSVLGLLLTANPQPSALDVSLNRCKPRLQEWRVFLKMLPLDELEGGKYLLTYMPLKDLQTLPTSLVRESLYLSYRARKVQTWSKYVPTEVFLDDVLPYANLTEPRQSMRQEFQQRYLPLVRNSKSPGEAALTLNATLFKDYKVTYNTHRLRTDQCPPETISQGMATCTGLSIMLVDALRAVGVPARVAGIHSWPGRGGNHTWVEVWDKGSWHFVGAAEPDAAGLDHSWFADEAGRAIPDKPLNSVWAVSYRNTGSFFPMMWAPDQSVPAVNVTQRYNKRLVDLSPRLMVEVKSHGERVIADVIAYNAANGDQCLIGQSKGPQADINLHLAAPVEKGGSYLVVAKYQGKSVTGLAKVDSDTVVHLDLGTSSSDSLQTILADRVGTDKNRSEAAAKLLAQLPYDTSSAGHIWDWFKSLPDPELKSQFDSNQVVTADRTSPYLWRKVGTKPAKGWGLVIAMHGGGGVPKSENDGEWHYMFDHYYKDHPEAGGYIYLALRAPNDNWNGFYDDSISPLIERLIWQFVKFGEVDPDTVYACGASHGGYGAFVIGPKIPYRFAAVHPAASAASDGETEGINLRNVRFTWSVGENDHDYGRVSRCSDFAKIWTEWQHTYGGFDGSLEVVPGHGHLINDWEANKTAEFRKYRRNATPDKVIWVQTDDVLHRFYWLEASKPVTKGKIEATIADNLVTLTTEKQAAITLWLQPTQVDVTKPIIVVRDGKRQQFVVKPNLGDYFDSLLKTDDPDLAAPIRIVVP